MFIKAIYRALCALCASTIFTAAAFAQAPTPYHPGETLSFTVTFTGPDADKVVGAQLSFELSGNAEPGQEAFSRTMMAGGGNEAAKGSLTVGVMIPKGIATGTYKLTRLSAGTRDVGWVYQSGLPDITVRVENPSHLKQPVLQSIKETSKP